MVTRVDAGARVEEQEHEVQPVCDARPVQGRTAQGSVRDVDHVVQGVLFFVSKKGTRVGQKKGRSW